MEQNLSKKEIKSILKSYYQDEKNVDVKVKFSTRIDDDLSQYFGKIVAWPYITVNYHNTTEELTKAKFNSIFVKQFDKRGYTVDDIKFNIEVSEVLEIPKFKGITISYTKTENKPMSRNLKKNS